jgi:uncharacterized membrane protein YfcA
MTLLADPLFLLLAVIAVTFLGISKGGFTGLGSMGVPVLSLMVSPPQAAAILLPVLLAQDIVSVAVYHRDFSAWNLKVLIPGAALGIVIATLTAAWLHEEYVRLTVGVIAILFVASRWAAPWLERHLPKPNAASGIFWGAVAGFTSAIANAGSPPFQIHMLPQKLPMMTFVGTTAVYFAASNAMKWPSYWALGQITRENMTAGAALIPLAVATNFLGVWLVRRVPTVTFYRIAYVLMLAIGIALVRSAAVEMGWL